MPNNFAAFFETLVAAAGEYNKAKKGQTALLGNVYMDVKPEAARVGKTVDVYFPDVGPLRQVNNGQLTPDTVSPNYIPLVFQTRVGKALQFQDFEQWQTASDLAEKFMEPLYMRAEEYLNGQIAALITPGNFNANAPIIGAVQGAVKVGEHLQAWDVLADQKVPLNDPSKLALFCHNNVYRKMLGDPEWVEEQKVSAAIAAAARERADLANAFNFRPTWDQQMPSSSGTVIYGQIAVTNGSAAVAGVASAFTSDLAVGQYLTFGSDPSRTQYKISAITSDTALTLTANYTGPTASATSARRIKVLTGTIDVTNGSAAVAGTGTSFTTELAVGDWLVVQGDATNTPYQVLAIGSNTALTLASNYGGTTAAGKLGTILSYTSVAMHKYAIAVALRPIATPKEASDVVAVTYIDLQGIPLRVMVSYVHIYQALYVTVDFGFAIGVIRPDFGVIIKS